jgi:hypothetical protein
LAVDVCVTSPFSVKNLRSDSPADDYGLRKHTKYDEGFSGSSFRFCALALETTGGVSVEGLSFLRQLWRFAARRQNTKLCVYAGRAWARLSCNLQTSVAQAILHRLPTGGHPPPQRTPSQVSVLSTDCFIPPSQVPSSCSSLPFLLPRFLASRCFTLLPPFLALRRVSQRSGSPLFVLLPPLSRPRGFGTLSGTTWPRSPGHHPVLSRFFLALQSAGFQRVTLPPFAVSSIWATGLSAGSVW